MSHACATQETGHRADEFEWAATVASMKFGRPSGPVHDSVSPAMLAIKQRMDLPVPRPNWLVPVDSLSPNRS